MGYPVCLLQSYTVLLNKLDTHHHGAKWWWVITYNGESRAAKSSVSMNTVYGYSQQDRNVTMKLIILGAGGHGRTVADIARQSERYTEVCFLDQNEVSDRTCLRHASEAGCHGCDCEGLCDEV